jgi:hypothetical protein
VDIYIPDQRPDIETTGDGTVRHGPGGYVPVSLDWGGPALWMGAPHALDLTAWTVTVLDRGATTATGVKVRIWLGRIERRGTPGWEWRDTITWIGPFALQDGNAQPQVEGLPNGPADQKLLVLAEATCPGDRANTDPFPSAGAAPPTAIGATGHPPRVPRLVADLVANDNNLGLWEVVFPPAAPPTA